jgi:hypothetical protein
MSAAEQGIEVGAGRFVAAAYCCHPVPSVMDVAVLKDRGTKCVSKGLNRVMESLQRQVGLVAEAWRISVVTFRVRCMVVLFEALSSSWGDGRSCWKCEFNSV